MNVWDAVTDEDLDIVERARALSGDERNVNVVRAYEKLQEAIGTWEAHRLTFLLREGTSEEQRLATEETAPSLFRQATRKMEVDKSRQVRQFASCSSTVVH